MSPISKETALEFCELCNWAYECWLTHRRLFDDNCAINETIGKSKYFTSRLSVITQEYSLLQICKLHDPAIQKANQNLSIGYIVEFGDWGPESTRIRKIELQLRGFFERIKLVRNKLLSHNDLETLMSSVALGEFPTGADEQYFAALQELANEVHMKWIDGPYPFNDLAGADADEFLSVLKRA